jgi:hypothetical protein
MTDNVILPATGETVAADDIGGVFYQQVKLINATADSTDPVGTDAYPMPVKGNTVLIRATPTLTTAGTYAANDYVGTSGTCVTFANAARVNNGAGWILGAQLIDYATQSVSGELWLFDTAGTPPADNAAWTMADASMARLVCVIPFSTYYASAVNSVSQGIPAAPAAFQTLAGSKDLYGVFVTRGAPVYATGDLTFILSVSQD